MFYTIDLYYPRNGSLDAVTLPKSHPTIPPEVTVIKESISYFQLML